MANQGYNALDQIIDYEYTSFLVDIIGNVWAAPDGGSGLVFHGLTDIILLPRDEVFVNVSGTQPYDNAPGGARNSMAQMDSTEAPYGDIVALHDFHCFIPTISALALETSDLFYDIVGDPNLLAKTPFDAVYYPTENQEHVSINPENAAWLMAEILGPPTAVASDSRVAPGVPVLQQNFPNPFNPATTIRFSLPERANVRLSIHDARGRLVVELIDQPMAAGSNRVKWNGTDTAGRPVGSGVYFYRLSAGDRVETKKMVLLK
jgi:hypothetical protein